MQSIHCNSTPTIQILLKPCWIRCNSLLFSTKPPWRSFIVTGTVLYCLNVLLCKGVTWSWASGRRVCKGSMSTPSQLCFSIMPQLQTTIPTGTRLGMLGPTWTLRLCSSTSTNSNSWVMLPGLGLYVVTITCLQPSETKTSLNCDITSLKKKYDMMICIVESL